jgi:bifunctional non-homologous end joining protein LigD
MGHLDEYRKKRDFGRTPEPAGRTGKAGERTREARTRTPVAEEAAAATGQAGGAFVVHKHAAQRLHFDLRLEQDGVLKSWAVPKGPSLDPGEKRLAVQVEDHPLEYGEFEGVIPEGEYGGGTVMLWDRGRWRATGKTDEDRLDFVLEGSKLQGAWTLVRMSGEKSEGGKNWLLIKRRDEGAGKGNGKANESRGRLYDKSVATGRTMKQIARDRDATWTAEGPRDDAGNDVLEARRLDGVREKALPTEPEAQLATLVDEAPAGEGWLHEIKFDGYRILARLERSEGDRTGEVRLISRNGKDWTGRFPHIAALVANLDASAALLDGEVVAYAADGSTSFRRLQEALSQDRTEQLVYQVFDLLHLEGYDLSGVSQIERKEALAGLMAQAGFTGSSTIRYSDHLVGKGPAFYQQACGLGLEGIISKRKDAGYRGGRGKDWLKVKCTHHQELLIGGYTDPGGARSGFGALLLGGYDDNGALRYAGKVGTGFSDRQLVDLHARLRRLEVDASAFEPAPPGRGVHWVEPELVAEVEFTEWTRDGSLRHPTFRGLREDREPEEIRMPPEAKVESNRKGKAKAGRKSARSGGKRRSGNDEAEVAGVRLSSPERVLYPEQGVTKLALARYYQDIEEWVLPQLRDRPLSLVRCPEGRAEQCFFQKHPRQAMAKGVARVEIEESDGPAPYLYVRSLPDVIALVQAGALELHVWGSRVDDVERPDIIVFDLDPAPEVPWSEMVRVAKELRERLGELGLESFARTTGGKGLHLVVPLRPNLRWDAIKEFAQAVARAHARDDRRITTNMSKAKRRGKIFLDYLRNGRGATAIASYSTRSREGAPVAVPVRWDEVGGALRPERYNIDNLRRRLASLRSDPWEGFDESRRALDSGMLKAVGIE